ncbi:gag protease polyprotein [Cucumis melo var. makuwa]|uniref:Gag protease polyprotein n=1 Tax=Cucumis melo var. makuwa TaxID=1194695 RepID=A0A5D3CIG4_CUCMM|nr:gag protease polyprotein [Cucumis melo var. makuwa]
MSLRELTLKFSGFVAGLFGDSFPFLGVDSIEGHNQVSSKGFPTTGPRIEAGSVVIHRELHCTLRIGVSFGITRLIHASSGITRLIWASFGITRLMCASFGITRLICASFEITKLIRVRVQRGADRRGARKIREGHMDVSGFLYASADVFCYSYFHCQESLVVVREMPPRRSAHRGGRGGRGRGARRVQLEGFDYADVGAAAACPASSCSTPTSVLVVLQVVPDQLSVEAKHLRDFKKYNTTTFDGSLEDPSKAQLWLSSLETIFRYMKCPEDQKLQCAISMLTDRGTAWWETTERMLGGDVGQITWQQFKESFYAKFFSASLRDAKRQEFLNLEQDDMTVEQYDVEFDMLSRFAPEMIATEAARADKFVRGLRLDIQGLVRAFPPATYADALRLAVDLSLQERANSSKVASRGSTSGQKRKAEQQPISVPHRNFKSGGEFRRFQQKPFETGDAARGKPLCTTCGKHHLGRCLFGTRICFKCRQEGHTADRYPMRLIGNAQNQGVGAPYQGKVFATNKTEDGDRYASNIGALRLKVELLHHVLSISIPSEECMLSKENVKACQIEKAGHVIEVTLLVLDMLDFDVILGMDWLATNHASIDCSRKEVAFNPPSMVSFKFKGEGSRSLPQVISAMRASKLLSQGTWSILASVVDTREVDVFLSSELVVRDYPDVFPEELPGLPPHREVEFAIELEPGTVPISKAPYRMAPAELKELKV